MDNRKVQVVTQGLSIVIGDQVLHVSIEEATDLFRQLGDILGLPKQPKPMPPRPLTSEGPDPMDPSRYRWPPHDSRRPMLADKLSLETMKAQLPPIITDGESN